ncbi:MAG: ATP-binding protein [Pseudomonadota bacterium]
MFQDLVSAIPFPVLLVDASGRIEATNDGARKLFGESIDARHYITVLRQPTLLDAVEQAVTRKTTTRAKYLTTEARRDITLQATCAPLPSGQVLISFEDRTHVEETFQMRRDFVANVSHELRTPLTALMGFIETLGGAAREDADARSRFLSIMEKEAGRMNRLVCDLLSLSRVEAEERIRPTSPVNLIGLASSVLHSLSPMAVAEGIRFQIDMPETEFTIPGDTDQLAQVVTNLVENAIKYSPSGSEVYVRVRAQSDHPVLREDAVVLSVKDKGEGIDEIHIPRLTERFYRIDAHRSREMGGTGLGLAIVKHIVNRHRGRLRIESKLGEGSCFSVILPMATAGATMSA